MRGLQLHCCDGSVIDKKVPGGISVGDFWSAAEKIVAQDQAACNKKDCEDIFRNEEKKGHSCSKAEEH